MVISFKEKNNAMRQVSIGAFAAGILGGVSEPSLYGILLRFRRSYYRLLPGCALGGAIIGLFDVRAEAFVFTSALTTSAMTPHLGYVLGITTAFLTSFLLTLFFGYRTAEEKQADLERIAREQGETVDDAAARAEMKFLKGNGTDSAIEGGAVPASSAGAAAAGVATKQAGKDAIALESPLEGEAVALSGSHFRRGKAGPGYGGPAGGQCGLCACRRQGAHRSKVWPCGRTELGQRRTATHSRRSRHRGAGRRRF